MNDVVATFTGIQNIKSAVIPRSLGFIPNPVVLICNPQTTPIPAGGTLTVSFNGIVLVMVDMKVDSASQHATTNGHVMVVRLIDRRWRWRFFRVSGRYNVRLPDGTIDPATQASVQSLASILLTAMGETVFDVSVLPTAVYPEVDWIYDIAAIQLARICEECGCDVSYNWDGSVSVVQLGMGPALPINADLQDGSVTSDPPESPNRLLVVCGETQFQCKFDLVAVGVDTDGSIKKIDDLSYKPSGGWEELTDDSFFTQMGEEDKTEIEIALARASVYRMYQISGVDAPLGGELDIPGYGTIDDIRQILPINNWTLQTFQSPIGNRMMRTGSVVRGMYLPPGDPESDENTDSCDIYDGEYVIDRYNGIVTFPVRVCALSGYKRRPASLTLETSFGLRESGTGGQVRSYVEYVASPGNMMDVTFREDLQVFYRSVYGDGSRANGCGFVEVVTNEADVAAEANVALNMMASRYVGAVYGSGKYRGLQPFVTSGTIRQVVIYVDDRKGINTTASYNSEVGPHIMRSAQRRQRRIIEENANINQTRHWWRRLGESGGLR